MGKHVMRSGCNRCSGCSRQARRVSNVARELRIDVWCDVCLADGQHEPGEPLEVSLDGRPKVLDLCERDRKTYVAPLAELLESLGRKPETAEPRAKRAYTKRAPVEATEAAAEGVTPCPLCGHVATTGGGLSSHLRRSHEVSVRELYGNICPVCGLEARGTHIGRAHTDDVPLGSGMPGAFAWAEANGDPHGVAAERRAAWA